MKSCQYGVKRSPRSRMDKKTIPTTPEPKDYTAIVFKDKEEAEEVNASSNEKSDKKTSSDNKTSSNS